MIKTKKYNYGNLMFVNRFTYDKVEQFADKIALVKLHINLRTLKDFKILIREELEDNQVVFYVEKKNEGMIVEYDFKDLLK